MTMRFALAKTPEEYKRCADIWLEASLGAHAFIPSGFWKENYAPMWSRYLPSSTVHTALAATGIIGFGSVKDNVLEALFVIPEAQGKGVGSSLLTYLFSVYDALSLAVYVKNPKAVAFYERSGFARATRQICAHTGEEEILMRWRR